MIGNGMFRYFSDKYDVSGTLKGKYKDYKLESHKNIYQNVDLKNFKSFENVLDIVHPDVVLNCSGIIKQKSNKYTEEEHRYLNSEIPFLISDLTSKRNFRLINFSTDCVFDGLKGSYKDDDIPNAQDIYGRSKALGEVRKENCLTIRTSTIGLEIDNKHGLLEWFLDQNTKTIQGYENAIYSGLTTKELAKYLEHILVNFHDLWGVYNMASEKISKYKLLSILSEKLEYCTIVVEKNTDFICDRSLNGELLDNLTEFKASNWEKMLSDLAIEINNRAKNEQNL